MPHTTYDITFNSAPVYNVRSMGYNDSAQVIVDRASGLPDPAKFYLGNMEPIVTLQTTDIASVIGLNTGTFVSAGLCVTGASTTIPLAKRADCGTLTSGGSHTTFVGTSVIAIPTQFEVRQDTEDGATASLEVRFRSSDGITSPVTVANNASLAASSHAISYGLGAAYIDDTLVDYLTGIVINPGLGLLLQRTGGGIYPTAHYIQFRDPTIDIMVENAAVAATFKDRYGSGNVAVRVFFRKRADGATYVADATTGHIRFAFAAAMSRMESLEAAQSGNGSTTLRCYGKALVATDSVAIA